MIGEALQGRVDDVSRLAGLGYGVDHPVASIDRQPNGLAPNGGRAHTAIVHAGPDAPIAAMSHRGSRFGRRSRPSMAPARWSRTGWLCWRSAQAHHAADHDARGAIGGDRTTAPRARIAADPCHSRSQPRRSRGTGPDVDGSLGAPGGRVHAGETGGVTEGVIQASDAAHDTPPLFGAQRQPRRRRRFGGPTPIFWSSSSPARVRSRPEAKYLIPRILYIRRATRGACGGGQSQTRTTRRGVLLTRFRGERLNVAAAIPSRTTDPQARNVPRRNQ